MRATPGADRPALDDDQIRTILANPIGTPRLRDLSEGKHQAVIIFDDLSRPTPVHRLWPFVVEELHPAGLGDEQIRMIVARQMLRKVQHVSKVGQCTPQSALYSL